MDKYRFIGPYYDAFCNILCGPALGRCRLSMLNEIKTGDKILFAGVGPGDDARFAARQGADVTVVELSETMLRLFQTHCIAEGLDETIRYVSGDIRTFDETGHYNTVVSNFFLNSFDPHMMQKVLAHLITMGQPGAQIIIGDFAPSTCDKPFVKIIKTINWFAANTLFNTMAQVPFHEIYQYPDYLRSLGLIVKEIKYQKTYYFKNARVPFFWSIRAQKPGWLACA